MLVTIRHRWHSELTHSVEINDTHRNTTTDRQLGIAVQELVRLGQHLSGLVLTSAYLGNASLPGAQLDCAKLDNAELGGANMRGADLSNAVLQNASLRGADLTDANLSGANLILARLSGARLTGVDLRYVAINDADLLSTTLDPELSELVVPSLHRRLLAAIQHGGQLKMTSWHNCDTTHCRAGWYVRLAGEAGARLEQRLGTGVTGAMIAVASCPALEGRVPNFYDNDESAMADIQRLAALEPELTTR